MLLITFLCDAIGFLLFVLCSCVTEVTNDELHFSGAALAQWDDWTDFWNLVGFGDNMMLLRMCFCNLMACRR